MYTKTDEAPMLATYSLLPIMQGFLAPFGIDVQLRDISVAARILAAFPEKLAPEQRVSDELQKLGELCQDPAANIIKLPNISASVPQMMTCIKELQDKGFNIPAMPTNPQTPEEKELYNRYSKVMGSAVNPVLREGNSDRRAPASVKMYAKKFPHRLAAWRPGCKTNVAHMQEGDFYHNEKSVTVEKPVKVRLELKSSEGKVTVLKELKLEAGEILDAAYLSKNKYVKFLNECIVRAKSENVLFSLHLKATMMKISDPIMFGHAVKVFYHKVFEKHGEVLTKLGVNPNNGFGDVEAKIATLDAETKSAIERTIHEAYDEGPELAMVNSAKGITNLHVPSDVIVDASMPAMIREGGQMWDAADRTRDTLALIPDSSYAGIYDEVVRFCKANGAFDPTTMGSTSNVGLMAQKAEEYGSHDKTFELPCDGTISAIDENGNVLLSHNVEQGDIWRACQTKDASVQDWIKLAVNRAHESKLPTVFWLDPERAHDRNLLVKVEKALKQHDVKDSDIRILSPKEAMKFSLERMKNGQDTISVTGNVLRDYLTDLFPILELGTSAKMLSIVPLMKGGGMFETGAGGSAPKHVEQFVTEGHLRWDSLGEFLALAVSLEHLAAREKSKKIEILSKALGEANAHFLLNNRSPTRKVNQLDNRGSHFYLALYWAQALANQKEDAELAAYFGKIHRELNEKRVAIINDFKSCQGKPVSIGGYYMPDEKLMSASMRPSASMNAIIDSMKTRS
jgi:isocitrate dehydrogenase